MCPTGFSMCQGYSDTPINTFKHWYRFRVLLADGQFPLEAEQPAVSLSSFFMKGLFKKMLLAFKKCSISFIISSF